MANRSVSEGDVNTSPLRVTWDAKHSPHTRTLLDRDAAVFLHQALSTPCLDVLTHAEGAWLTTLSGQRILDFHGNSVHQLGHAHPAVVAAMEEQLRRCCQTNANPSPFPSNGNMLGCKESAPLGESGGAPGLEIVSAM